MLEAVTAVVAEPLSITRVLCGDFNLPQAEMLDGRIVTWAERVIEGADPRLRERFRLW